MAHLQFQYNLPNLPETATTQFIDTWHVRDHLGSVRTIIDGDTGQVVETNDYYAFGGRWDRSGSLVDQSNRYRYNGKEEQATFGTPYSDYGARQYSSFNGRWLTVDPLAEKYYSSSPYAFCNNNPVNFVDPDGRRWVNSFGQVIYDENGLSANASMEEIELVKAMLQTRTGTKQLDKIASSPIDIVVVIDNDEAPKKGYGHNKINGIKYNTRTRKYYPSSECEIAIYKKRLKTVRTYLKLMKQWLSTLPMRLNIPRVITLNLCWRDIVKKLLKHILT